MFTWFDLSNLGLNCSRYPLIYSYVESASITTRFELFSFWFFFYDLRYGDTWRRG
uniref:Uncharacterized protein n=1 Tax=Arundo donax TaxID=35708 RepID=A0A0A9T4H8_ARUDO